jgi:anti-anti-sigma factor
VELVINHIKEFTIIKIIGKVDWENARLLDSRVQTILEEGRQFLAFNLDEVSFLCSGGIGVLIYNLNRIKKDNGALYIISSNEYVNYIFETLKFGVVFDKMMFDSEEQFLKQIVEKS